MSNVVSMSLPTINAGVSRGFYKEVRATVVQWNNSALTNAAAVDGNFNGETEYKFSTAFNQRVHMDKSYFAVTDFLYDGATLVATTPTCAAARTWNHCSALFQNMQIDINGTNVENINEVAEVDSYCKRVEYDESYFKNIGECFNLKYAYGVTNGSDSISRHTDAMANPKTTYLWHPNCSGIFQQTLPQNLDISIKMRPAANKHFRVVDGVAATDPGVVVDTFRYGVSEILLYVYITEESNAPRDTEIKLDLRPVFPAKVTWTGAATLTYNYNVPATTYQMGIVLASSTRNTDTLFSPTIFKCETNKQDFLSYRIKYASYDFPQFQITEVAAQRFYRGYLNGALDFSKDVNFNGGESYAFWREQGPMYNFDVIKRADDHSTIAEVTLTAPAAFNGEDVYLMCRHSRVVIIGYGSDGRVTNVSAENA